MSTIPEAALSQHIAILGTFTNSNGPYWHALIGIPGRPFTASVQSICWRKYKSRAHALRAGRRALKRIFGAIEIRE